MHYGIQQTGFEKYKDNSFHYAPQDNKKNIFERKLKHKMPSTRDRFIGNPLSSILAPGIKRKQLAMYNHDKLVVKDIEGTVVNTYGR